jgi:hypothetical protein
MPWLDRGRPAPSCFFQLDAFLFCLGQLENLPWRIMLMGLLFKYALTSGARFLFLTCFMVNDMNDFLQAEHQFGSLVCQCVSSYLVVRRMFWASILGCASCSSLIHSPCADSSPKCYGESKAFGIRIPSNLGVSCHRGPSKKYWIPLCTYALKNKSLPRHIRMWNTQVRFANQCQYSTIFLSDQPWLL